MRPSFHPRLINGPFDDPGLYIPFQFQNRAILFDLGDIAALAPRDILKISDIFITHTHMDHFIGFDHLLRLVLGRDKQIHFYGPQGFIDNLAGKLAGYTWNLLHNYENRLILNIHEIHPDKIVTARAVGRNRFQIAAGSTERPAGPAVHSEPALTVEALQLDHGTPCLGFCLKERFHVNIRKDRLADLGLETGPWLQRFKQALYTGQAAESEFEVDPNQADGSARSHRLGELADEIAMITPGQKTSYIADTLGGSEAMDRIVEFVRESDHLFIEAAFLDEDRRIATRKNHLTARQAGTIAGKAHVKKYTLFHFSPRYQGMQERIEAEAEAEYLRWVGK
jgi:ribonuclease Z